MSKNWILRRSHVRSGWQHYLIGDNADLLEALAVRHYKISDGHRYAKRKDVSDTAVHRVEPGGHYRTARSVTDDLSAFFKLYDLCEDFSRRRRFGIDEYHEVSFVDTAAARLCDPLLCFLASFLVTDLNVLVEKVAGHSQLNFDKTTAITAEIDDQIFV